MAARVDPIVKWPGGKRRLCKHLLPLLPPHVCYVEVFGGGAALLLAKEPSKVEVYNDLNTELVNAFRMAKHHHPELLRELSLMPNSRLEMKLRRTRAPWLTEIQRAAMFLHDRLISFGGDGQSFGVQKSAGGGAASSTAALGEKIAAFAARFDRVVVECSDWRKILALYDSPATVFFLDPPYDEGAQKSYRGFSLDEWRELAAALATLKGAWLLTTSASPAMRELFTRGGVRRQGDRPRPRHRRPRRRQALPRVDHHPRRKGGAPCLKTP